MFNLHSSKSVKHSVIVFPKTVRQFEVIKPYARDLKTGKLLNDTNHNKYKEIAPFNMFEYIQSFKTQCDVYKLIDKAKLTNDMRILQVKEGAYSDIHDLPTDFTGMRNLISKAKEIDLDKVLGMLKAQRQANPQNAQQNNLNANKEVSSNE